MTDRSFLNCGPVADYHLHPDYSFDGHGTLEEWCQTALRIGLSEICFTPHYEADPARRDHDGFIRINGEKLHLNDEALAAYLDHTARLHEEYGLIGFMVRGGIEFGYFDGFEKELARLRERFSFHYCLGGVHNIDGIGLCEHDEAPQLFKHYPLEQLADRYFERLDRLAASGLVDALAHMDVYRRYGLEFYGAAVNTIHRGRVEKLFQTMLAHDVGYELNTAAIRHGLAEYYPGMEIVNMAREAGVRLIALGSDAHYPKDMALDFDAAMAVAYELSPYVDE